jgi:hypothetical protein
MFIWLQQRPAQRVLVMTHRFVGFVNSIAPSPLSRRNKLSKSKPETAGLE